jgi:hypothetical protein
LYHAEKSVHRQVQSLVEVINFFLHRRTRVESSQVSSTNTRRQSIAGTEEHQVGINSLCRLSIKLKGSPFRLFVWGRLTRGMRQSRTKKDLTLPLYFKEDLTNETPHRVGQAALFLAYWLSVIMCMWVCRIRVCMSGVAAFPYPSSNHRQLVFHTTS